MSQRAGWPERFLTICAFALIGAMAMPVVADEPDLVAERPGQSESASIVPPGRVQIEAGWTMSNDDEDGVEVEVSAVPGTVVRIGLTDKMELRLGWTGNLDEEIDTGAFEFDDDGSGDASVGAKFLLREGRGSKPAVALLLGTSLPTGDDDFSSDRADPSVRVAVAHGLTDRLGLGYNVGLNLATERAPDGDKDTQAGFVYTSSLGIGITDRLGAFVELFGDIPSSAGGGPSHSADGGFAFMLRDNLQLDLSGGVGLNDRADDWFVGVGISARLPR